MTSTARALGRLLSQAADDRLPNRAATLNQARDKHLEVADLEVSTREARENEPMANRPADLIRGSPLGAAPGTSKLPTCASWYW